MIYKTAFKQRHYQQRIQYVPERNCFISIIRKRKANRKSIKLKCFFHQFNFIQKKSNQMSCQLPDPSLQQILSLFDSLIANVPQVSRDCLSILSPQRFKKQIEILPQKQAREVLIQLIHKSKTMLNRKNWKVDETNYLLFVVDKYCFVQNLCSQQLQQLDWEHISKLVPNRDSSACQFRYLSSSPTSISNVPWSSYEQQLLLRIIQSENSNNLNWKCISERFYEESDEKIFRTGKQCRQHYSCFLRPNLKKGSWTDEEDFQLICQFLKLGKKWSRMTNLIEGRNENSIKNRFFLMFENKKEIKLTQSDLTKMVRRRKEKLQRKLAPKCEQWTIYKDLNLTPTNNSDSSNFQINISSPEALQPSSEVIEGQITITEQQNLQPDRDSLGKVEEVSASWEFEQYIDL